MHWHDLNQGDLLNWVSQQQVQSAPPLWKLADPRNAREYLPPQFSANLGPQVRLDVRDDSGCVQLELDQRIPIDVNRAFISDQMLQLARAFDEREYRRQAEPTGPPGYNTPSDAPYLSAEFESLVNGWEVIGAGGRVLVYNRGAQLADVIVRRRTRAVDSAWRNPTSVIRRTQALLAATGPETTVRTAVGYYEASKYERQETLRLAFAFLVERTASTDGTSWRTLLVEPATASTDEPDWSGLEAWADEGSI